MGPVTQNHHPRALFFFTEGAAIWASRESRVGIAKHLAKMSVIFSKKRKKIRTWDRGCKIIGKNSPQGSRLEFSVHFIFAVLNQKFHSYKIDLQIRYTDTVNLHNFYAKSLTNMGRGHSDCFSSNGYERQKQRKASLITK